jgi:hypothetical protein
MRDGLGERDFPLAVGTNDGVRHLRAGQAG